MNSDTVQREAINTDAADGVKEDGSSFSHAFIRELGRNKRFWLLPLLVAMAGVAGLMAVESWSTVRSFIYPLL